MPIVIVQEEEVVFIQKEVQEEEVGYIVPSNSFTKSRQA